jgi:hypothetical protein
MLFFEGLQKGSKIVKNRVLGPKSRGRLGTRVRENAENPENLVHMVAIIIFAKPPKMVVFRPFLHPPKNP